MLKPEAGLQAFHDGRPVELLYRVEETATGEVWRVRPLFIEGAERDEVFSEHDRLTPLHSAPKLSARV